MKDTVCCCHVLQRQVSWLLPILLIFQLLDNISLQERSHVWYSSTVYKKGTSSHIYLEDYTYSVHPSLLPKIYDQEASNVFTALSKTMVEFDMFPIGQKMDGASFSE